MNGFFISLDGIDGCGKSTQAQLLAEWLHKQGHQALPCADPGTTSLGWELRNLLLNSKENIAPRSEALLFMASRAQLVDRVIRPALDQGQIVISDRFLLANVVYQGHAGGLNPDDLWKVGKWAADGIEPDLTFVLDLPPEVARERRQGPGDRMEQREEKYHQRVREGFLIEVKRKPEQIIALDATRPIEDLHRAICQEVERALGQREGA